MRLERWESKNCFQFYPAHSAINMQSTIYNIPCQNVSTVLLE